MFSQSQLTASINELYFCSSLTSSLFPIHKNDPYRNYVLLVLSNRNRKLRSESYQGNSQKNEILQRSAFLARQLLTFKHLFQTLLIMFSEIAGKNCCGGMQL